MKKGNRSRGRGETKEKRDISWRRELYYGEEG